MDTLEILSKRKKTLRKLMKNYLTCMMKKLSNYGNILELVC